MKILHIISSINPAGGGTVEGIKQMGAVHVSLGHTVEVASLDAANDSWVTSFPLPIHTLGPGMLGYAYSGRIVPWLRENSRNYDVVIVNGLWQYHGFATWRALRNSSTPYVVFTHGMLDPWFKKTYPLKHLKKSLYWPWAEYRVLRDAKAVLFTCEEERVLARQSFERYQCNEVVVNFGTAGPNGDPETQLQTFYSRYPQLRGKRLAVFLGRLHEKKGCDILIEAFAKVLAADSDWHLLMCGPDQTGWQSTLQTMANRLKISDRVTWAGMVTGDMKWGALRASEVFVLPSHQENFGIVVPEALACGVPALISNKVNIWREVEADGAGIVGDDTLEGSCKVLRSWLGMPDQQRSEMRTRARECFQDRFEIKRAADSLIEALTRVVSERATHYHACF